MYNLGIDIRDKSKECIYALEDGGNYKLIIDDYDTKVTLKTSYEQLDDVRDSLLEQCGYKAYSTLEDENDKLKAKVEELNNIIEQYEEHQDILREKYYQPF